MKETKKKNRVRSQESEDRSRAQGVAVSNRKVKPERSQKPEIVRIEKLR